MISPTTILLLFSPLIIWRIYSRLRRAVGRQKLTRIRPWLTVSIIPLSLGTIGAFAIMFGDPWASISLVAGIFSGLGLAFYGLHMTKFEKTENGYYFTPNTYLGAFLSLILIGRVGYRLLQIIESDGGLDSAPPNVFQSPLTLAIVGLVMGYYLAYMIGILIWRFRFDSSEPENAGLR
jgi:hypothetical protein